MGFSFLKEHLNADLSTFQSQHHFRAVSSSSLTTYPGSFCMEVSTLGELVYQTWNSEYAFTDVNFKIQPTRESYFFLKSSKTILHRHKQWCYYTAADMDTKPNLPCIYWHFLIVAVHNCLKSLHKEKQSPYCSSSFLAS